MCPAPINPRVFISPPQIDPMSARARADRRPPSMMLEPPPATSERMAVEKSPQTIPKRGDSLV
jgi:hypothetical protein